MNAAFTSSLLVPKCHLGARNRRIPMIPPTNSNPFTDSQRRLLAAAAGWIVAAALSRLPDFIVSLAQVQEHHGPLPMKRMVLLWLCLTLPIGVYHCRRAFLLPTAAVLLIYLGDMAWAIFTLLQLGAPSGPTSYAQPRELYLSFIPMVLLHLLPLAALLYVFFTSRKAESVEAQIEAASP